MTNNEKAWLHRALLQLRTDYEARTLRCLRGGICVNLSIAHEELLPPLVALWSEYSGNVSYPVPCRGSGPLHAYYKHAEGLNPAAMWYEGEYAAARVRLLDFLIEQTK